jgi:hypothetical protein
VKRQFLVNLHIKQMFRQIPLIPRNGGIVGATRLHRNDGPRARAMPAQAGPEPVR